MKTKFKFRLNKHGAATLPTFVVYNAPRLSVKKFVLLVSDVGEINVSDEPVVPSVQENPVVIWDRFWPASETV